MTREASAVAVAALLALATRTWALPDLAPDIEAVSIEVGQAVSSGDFAEGCAGGRVDRTLVRFGVRFTNGGPDPLVLGDPGCPDCQTNPGVICADPDYECSPADGHDHPHFIDFARYELLDLDGNVLAQGGKRTFCARDSACPGGPADLFYTCDFQGIGVGCNDYYDPQLGCQYIDATDVPDVTRRAFRLRVTYDPDHKLPDGDRSNDVFEYPVPGCGDGVVGGDEECDPGTTSEPCCDETCRLRPAGTSCRAATGPCDAAETCDGASSACPADRAADDGTPCGDGGVACEPSTCRAGVCSAALQPGWCLIDGSCVASGTHGPDGCSSCDPAHDAGAWTRVLSPDATGIGCRLGDMRTATAAACPTKRGARLVRRIELLATRLERLKPTAFYRACQRFVRSGRRSGCVADGEALLQQARDYAASAPPGGGR